MLLSLKSICIIHIIPLFLFVHMSTWGGDLFERVKEASSWSRTVHRSWLQDRSFLSRRTEDSGPHQAGSQSPGLETCRGWRTYHQALEAIETATTASGSRSWSGGCCCCCPSPLAGPWIQPNPQRQQVTSLTTGHSASMRCFWSSVTARACSIWLCL